MVDLNITLWIQLANFLVTLVVLNYLLISPIRKIIRKRKDNVEGLIGEIEAFTAEKQQLLDEYESELRKAREAAAIYRKDGKVMGELEQAAGYLHGLHRSMIPWIKTKPGIGWF